MFRLSVRPRLHYAILLLVLMVFPVAHYHLASSYCQMLIMIHLIRQISARKAGHHFMHDVWYDRDWGGRISSGVLVSPKLQSLLIVGHRQHVEDLIQYHRYLIGATGHGATMLSRLPWTPFPSWSSYFYIQTMPSGCGCLLPLAKILLISWRWHHARIGESTETKP